MQIPFDIDDFPGDLSGHSREAEFLQGLVESYRNIYACALSVVGNRADAEDVVQEVCVVLWQKFDDYETGTNFRNWAATVTFNVAKAFARQRKKERGLGFSDHVLAKVTRVRTAGSELYELRRELLRECVSKLTPKDQRFLKLCYRKHSTLVDYAKTTQTPIGTVYTKLKRLRKRLSECVRRSMEADQDTA